MASGSVTVSVGRRRSGAREPAGYGSSSRSPFGASGLGWVAWRWEYGRRLMAEKAVLWTVFDGTAISLFLSRLPWRLIVVGPLQSSQCKLMLPQQHLHPRLRDVTQVKSVEFREKGSYVAV